MKAETLVATMPGLSLARANLLVTGCNEALVMGGMNTINRVAMFLAQVGEESSSLRYTEEIADGSAYNGRIDLGNTQPGDGPRFKGRSFIQITGRTNYTNFSQWAFSKGLVPTADYFIKNPTYLSNYNFAWLGAIWYFTVARPNLNRLADSGDVVAATRAVNGGLNGLADRQDRWNRCLALGSAILPEIPFPVTKEIIDMDAPALQKMLAALYRQTVDNVHARIIENSGPRFVQFPKAPKNPNAIYAWDGAYLTWMTPTDWRAIAAQTKQLVVITDHANSNIYRCPIAPGTPDPRK